MLLSGEEIQEEIQSGHLVIEPVPAAHSVQPASIDLRRITLEMYNLGLWTIELKGGMTICTLLVERLSRPAQGGYDGMFQGS